MCIYIYNIYIYVCVCVCVCIYIYIIYNLYKWSEVIHNNRVLKTHRSKMGVYTSYPQVHELPQSHCGDNQKGILFS